MSPLAQLADEVGTSERTLRRAVEQGTLRASRPTPRKLVLPLAEREYIRRRWALLARLRAVLRTEHNVRFALLFGSAARGTDASLSDLDVLVDLREPSLSGVIDLEERLEVAVGRKVEVVRLEDSEKEPAFLAEAIADGRVLVDRDGRWRDLLQLESSLRRRGAKQERRRALAALDGIDRLLAR